MTVNKVAGNFHFGMSKADHHVLMTVFGQKVRSWPDILLVAIDCHRHLTRGWGRGDEVRAYTSTHIESPFTFVAAFE